ncbi:hypothetical protein BGX27_008965 [Mortierella sp. AM989]|nr:hypothetical protein BGX27_008965 [Mortierella sp. AM989]
MADNQNTDASVSTFVSSVIFTSVVSIALFSAFALLRSRFPRVYAPKTYIGSERERIDGSFGGVRASVLGSRKITENEFIERCGLDAYMFIEFLQKSFFLFLGFAFLAIPILIPLNSSQQLGLVGLNQFTIANIADKKRLWAHLVLTVHYLMGEHHLQSPQATTILVCGIPRGLNNVQSLHNLFSAFPGGVKRIWLAHTASDLQKDIDRRIVIARKLEAAESKLIRDRLNQHLNNGRRSSYASTNPLSSDNTNRRENRQIEISDESFPSESRPHHHPASFPMSLFARCCGAEKVDSILTYRGKLSMLNASILERQQAGMPESKNNGQTKAAFIQFNHQLGAHLAAQAVIHRQTLAMTPRHLEVHPKDVLWDNLGLGSKTRNIRRAVSTLLAAALIIFWSIPVAFVASVAKLESIVKFAPFLSGIYSLPNVVVGIIQGVLPPIGLAVLMMLLPIILYKLAYLGGAVLHTGKMLAVVTIFHWFSPLILPLAAILFGLYYLAFRYMFLYVYRQPFDSGGLIFPRIIDQIYIGVILFEIVMLGLFVLQKTIGQSIVMFVLLVLSLFTIVGSRNRVFKPLIMYLPVEAFDTQAVHAVMGGNAVGVACIPGIAPEGTGTRYGAGKHESAVDSLPANSGDISEKYENEKLTSPTMGRDAAPPESQHLRHESFVSRQTPLLSISVEKAGDIPRSRDEAPSRHGHLHLRGSEQDEVGAGSSLQVLGANHSILSSSDAAAEKVVPERLTYMNPAFWKQIQPIWLPKDPRGFAELEIVELINTGLPCTTDAAIMDTKGGISVEVYRRETAPGEEIWE